MAVEAHRRFGIWRRRKARASKFLASGIGARWDDFRARHKWWHLTIFIIGVIAATSVVGALFFAVGSKPERIYTDAEVPPVESPHFSTALAMLVGAPIEEGGAITILNNGDEFVPALLQSINDAKRTINFSVYIWSDGAFSDTLLEALEKKQREGVAVRILLDGLGAMRISDKAFEPLMAAGARIQKFRTPQFG